MAEARHWIWGGGSVDAKLQPNRVKGVGRKRPRASGKMGGVEN